MTMQKELKPDEKSTFRYNKATDNQVNSNLKNDK
jgi:hypothetical protein